MWYRAVLLVDPRLRPNRKVRVPTTFVWSDRDVRLRSSGRRAHRAVRRRALRARGPGGRQPLDPHPGAGGARRGDHQADRVRMTQRPPAPEPLPHPVVDNHCHLDISRDGEPVDVRGGPRRRGGGGRAPDRADRLRPARRAVGGRGGDDVRRPGRRGRAAPQRGAAARRRLDDALAEIEALATSRERVRAVGETGLDHFRTGEEGRAAQVASFRRHIDLAKRLDKTLVIHDRDAHDEVLRGPRRGGHARAVGDALLLRRRRRRPPRASTAAPTSRSPAR